MRLAVLVHVFYPDFWPQLATCIRNLSGEIDLWVTYVDETAVRQARADFPAAHFLACENRGFDIWPFLKVLKGLDLDRYDLVVKLHTKRNVNVPFDMVFNHCRFNGSAWREHLLSFCSSARAWRRTLRRFGDPKIGLVADRHVLIGRNSVPPPARRPDGSLIGNDTRVCFDEAAEEIASLVGGSGRPDLSRALFAAGTMFVIRPTPLKLLLKRAFVPEMFDPPDQVRQDGIARHQYAHRVERMLGLCVYAQGLRAEANNGSVALRARYYEDGGLFWKIIRLIFFKKIVKSGTVIRILNIRVKKIKKPPCAC